MEQVDAPGECKLPLRNPGLKVFTSFLTERLQVIILSPPQISRPPQKVTWSYEPNKLKRPWLILLKGLDQYLEANLVLPSNESLLT